MRRAAQTDVQDLPLLTYSPEDVEILAARLFREKLNQMTIQLQKKIFRPRQRAQKKPWSTATIQLK
jgi:hypothetical protein